MTSTGSRIGEGTNSQSTKSEIALFSPPPCSYKSDSWSNKRFKLIDSLFSPNVKIPLQRIVWAGNESTPKASLTVLVCGNLDEDMGQLSGFGESLSDSLHVDVVLFDYQGFGLNKSMPFGEQKCFEDTISVFAWLVDEIHIETKDILVVGRYLGSGPAVHLASNLQREDQQQSTTLSSSPVSLPSLNSSTSSLTNSTNNNSLSSSTSSLTNSSSSVSNNPPAIVLSTSPPTNNSNANAMTNTTTTTTTTTTTPTTSSNPLTSSLDKSSTSNVPLSSSKGLLRRGLSQRLSALLPKNKTNLIPYSDIAGLILISPLASSLRLLNNNGQSNGTGFNLSTTISSLIVHDMFDNVSKAPKVQCPTCIIFDKRLQAALPLYHSQKLAPKFRNLWKFLEIQGILEDDTDFLESCLEFVQEGCKRNVMEKTAIIAPEKSVYASSGKQVVQRWLSEIGLEHLTDIFLQYGIFSSFMISSIDELDLESMNITDAEVKTKLLSHAKKEDQVKPEQSKVVVSPTPLRSRAKAVSKMT